MYRSFWGGWGRPGQDQMGLNSPFGNASQMGIFNDQNQGFGGFGGRFGGGLGRRYFGGFGQPLPQTGGGDPIAGAAQALTTVQPPVTPAATPAATSPGTDWMGNPIPAEVRPASPFSPSAPNQNYSANDQALGRQPIGTPQSPNGPYDLGYNQGDPGYKAPDNSGQPGAMLGNPLLGTGGLDAQPGVQQPVFGQDQTQLGIKRPAAITNR